MTEHPWSAEGGSYPAPGQPVGALPREAYTPWVHRLYAFVLDYAPILVVTSGPEILLRLLGNPLPSGTVRVITVISWLAALAFAIWNWGYRQGTTGSSMGKSQEHFKVVSEKTGRPIGFGMSVVRQLAHVVDWVICFVGFLFPLWDSKRQTLADKIVSTVCLPIQSRHS